MIAVTANGSPSTIAVVVEHALDRRDSRRRFRRVRRGAGGHVDAQLGVAQHVEGLREHGRRVVHREDVDGHHVGRRIEVHPAVGRAAVVAHLERERGVRRPERVERGLEPEIAGGDVRQTDLRAGGKAGPGQRQAAGGRQRGDHHRLQRVGRRVVRVGEAEVGRRERQLRVLVGRHRRVRPGRRVVPRRDVDGERVRRRVEIHAAVGGPPVVAHLEREAWCRATRWHSPRA